MIQKQLLIETKGRGFYPLSDLLQGLIEEHGLAAGLCHCFVHHTSASLVIMENADPTVLQDLENFMSRLVIDGDPLFRHTDEGPDDMSAHVRTALTHTDLTIPVSGSRLALGTWQGVFLWEHRTAAHQRRLTITLT